MDMRTQDVKMLAEHQSCQEDWENWLEFKSFCGLSAEGNFWGNNAHIFAKDLDDAKAIWQAKRQKLSHAALIWKRASVQIFWSFASDAKPISIRPNFISSQEGNIIMSSESQIITDAANIPFAKELEISWDEVNRSKDAYWVICQTTQRVLFANYAAILANGNKPPTDILNSEINALWEDEALAKLIGLVNRTNKWIENHTNTGYRWERNEHDGGLVWTRRKHEFNVDYHKITYLGVPARFEHVKDAVPV